MRSQEPEHAARLEQMPSHRLRIKNFPLIIRSTLHPKIIPTTRDQTLDRHAGDYLGEQFMQWFLKEQVEEVALMTTLVRVSERAGADLFHLEDFVAREIAAAESDATAPKVAGGRL
jgi:hypothetical protein